MSGAASFIFLESRTGKRSGDCAPKGAAQARAGFAVTVGLQPKVFASLAEGGARPACRWVNVLAPAALSAGPERDVTMQLSRSIRRTIQRLGPYPSLLLLAGPVALVEPLKLVAVLVFGSGHWMTGAVVMACAYLLSVFIVHKLFRIVKPKLLKLRWFAAVWMRFVAARDKLLVRLRAKWMLRDGTF